MKKLDFYQVAEVELTYKSKVRPEDRPVISCSLDAFSILLHAWSDKIELVEEFNILALNKRNQVIAFSNISKGSSVATIVDAKMVFLTAIKLNAASIILAHNHPSGNLRPSQQDIDLTDKLVSAGKLLTLPILDHLIVTRLGYYSFADEGIIN